MKTAQVVAVGSRQSAREGALAASAVGPCWTAVVPSVRLARYYATCSAADKSVEAEWDLAAGCMHSCMELSGLVEDIGRSSRFGR